MLSRPRLVLGWVPWVSIRVEAPALQACSHINKAKVNTQAIGNHKEKPCAMNLRLFTHADIYVKWIDEQITSASKYRWRQL